MANSYRDKDRWAQKNGKGGRKVSHKGHLLNDDEDDFDLRKALEFLEEEEEEEFKKDQK